MQKTTTLSAPDIECQGCANSIKNALSKVPGVSGVNVDVTAKTVIVAHDDAKASRETITSALDQAGFPAS